LCGNSASYVLGVVLFALVGHHYHHCAYDEEQAQYGRNPVDRPRLLNRLSYRRLSNADKTCSFGGLWQNPDLGEECRARRRHAPGGHRDCADICVHTGKCRAEGVCQGAGNDRQGDRSGQFMSNCYCECPILFHVDFDCDAPSISTCANAPVRLLQGDWRTVGVRESYRGRDLMINYDDRGWL